MLQIAEVHAVQLLWKRCDDAVQSLRTPCGGLYFEHVQPKRRGLPFAQRFKRRGTAFFTARGGYVVATL